MQQIVLFYVFVVFFVGIGVLSLLVVSGAIKSDPAFRKWAGTGFIGSVTVAVIGLFYTVTQPVSFVVTLSPPTGTTFLELTKGYFETDELDTFGTGVKTRQGEVLFRFENSGVWVAELPRQALNKRSVTLKFTDKKGDWWETSPFNPSSINQPITKSAAPPQTPVSGVHIPITGEAIAAVPNPSSGEHKTSSEQLVVAQFREKSARATPKFNNYTRIDRKFNQHTIYRWRVFVDESPNVLDKIAEVRYALLPTFPQPSQVRSDPSTKFALEETSLEAFHILIMIRFKDGRLMKTSYKLDMEKKGPGKAIGTDDVFHDTQTALMWTKKDNGERSNWDEDINWDDANTYCEKLLIWGGHQDWRLPTIDELGLLYVQLIDGKYGIRPPFQLTSPHVWSSTKPVAKIAFVFNFFSGDIFSTGLNHSIHFSLSEDYYDDLSYSYANHRVLCVRDAGDHG